MYTIEFKLPNTGIAKYLNNKYNYTSSDICKKSDIWKDNLLKQQHPPSRKIINGNTY